MALHASCDERLHAVSTTSYSELKLNKLLHADRISQPHDPHVWVVRIYLPVTLAHITTPTNHVFICLAYAGSPHVLVKQ